jgi:SAM-dependent methyltransferase
VLLQHVAMNISDRARLYREIRRVLKEGGRFATFDVVSNNGEPLYPLPWARTPATSFLLTAAATREAIEPAGFRTLAWQDDSENAKAWFALLRASGPPPSPNLSVVMGTLRSSLPTWDEISWKAGRGFCPRCSRPLKLIAALIPEQHSMQSSNRCINQL